MYCDYFCDFSFDHFFLSFVLSSIISFDFVYRWIFLLFSAIFSCVELIRAFHRFLSFAISFVCFLAISCNFLADFLAISWMINHELGHLQRLFLLRVIRLFSNCAAFSKNFDAFLYKTVMFLFVCFLFQTLMLICIKLWCFVCLMILCRMNFPYLYAYLYEFSLFV